MLLKWKMSLIIWKHKRSIILKNKITQLYMSKCIFLQGETNSTIFFIFILLVRYELFDLINSCLSEILISYTQPLYWCTIENNFSILQSIFNITSRIIQIIFSKLSINFFFFEKKYQIYVLFLNSKLKPRSSFNFSTNCKHCQAAILMHGKKKGITVKRTLYDNFVYLYIYVETFFSILLELCSNLKKFSQLICKLRWDSRMHHFKSSVMKLYMRFFKFLIILFLFFSLEIIDVIIVHD